MGKIKIIIVNGVIGVIINVVLSIILFRYIGIIGIVLVLFIVMLVMLMFLFWSIIKFEKIFRIKDMIKKISLVILNLLIMGVVFYILGVNLNGKL